MTKKYRTFESVEQGGQTYVIAQPTSETDEPVRLDGSLFEGGSVDDGIWTAVVSQLIQFDMTGALNLQDGQGRMTRAEAVESLLGADGEVPITEESEAEAVIDYFGENGVFEIEGNEIVLLRNPASDRDLNAKMLMNWVSAIDGCVEKIDSTVETIEQARKDLQAEMSDTTAADVVSDFEEQQAQVAQQIANITGGRLDIQDMEEVPPDQRAEFERLKEQFYHLETMKEAAETDNLDGEISDAASKLARKKQQLENIRDVLVQKRDNIRTAAVAEDLFPEDAIDMVQNLENLISSLTGIEGSHERAEDKSTAELMSDVSEIVDQADQAAETMGVDESETLEQT